MTKVLTAFYSEVIMFYPPHDIEIPLVPFLFGALGFIFCIFAGTHSTYKLFLA